MRKVENKQCYEDGRTARRDFRRSVGTELTRRGEGGGGNAHRTRVSSSAGLDILDVRQDPDINSQLFQKQAEGTRFLFARGLTFFLVRNKRE